MKKLGIYGIIIGITAAFYTSGLVLYSYFNAARNFRKLGADPRYFMPPLFLNIFKEMWLFFLMLIIFSVLNIYLGIQLIKYKTSALRIWILYYAFLIVLSAGWFAVNKLFPLDFLWNATILYISIKIFREQNKQ